MKKLLVIVTVLLFAYVISMPIKCLTNARILEEDTEEITVLGGDPCEDGRVCQQKCSCGKTFLFRVDDIMKKDSTFSTVFKKVCIQNKYEQYISSERVGRFHRSKTISSGGDSQGFIFKELQKALNTIGKRQYSSYKRGFGYLYAKIMNPPAPKNSGRSRSKHKPIIDPAAQFLARLAMAYRDFLHVCKRKSDWKSKIDQRVNSVFNTVYKKYYKSSYEKLSKRQLKKSANSLKTNVANYLKKDNGTAVKYCSCSSLNGNHRIAYQKRRTGRPSRGSPRFVTAYKFVSFPKYKSKLNDQCKRLCKK
eukprot:gene7923-12391_t